MGRNLPQVSGWTLKNIGNRNLENFEMRIPALIGPKYRIKTDPNIYIPCLAKGSRKLDFFGYSKATSVSWGIYQMYTITYTNY